MITTIGTSFAIPTGVAGVVLASAAALGSLSAADIVAAAAALTAGISGVVALRKLQGPAALGPQPPAATGEQSYSKAA